MSVRNLHTEAKMLSLERKCNYSLSCVSLDIKIAPLIKELNYGISYICLQPEVIL